MKTITGTTEFNNNKLNNLKMKTTTGTIERMGTTKSEFKGDVQIRRVHKSSPYGLAHFVPDVAGASADEVFCSKKIQKLIAKTFGRKIEVSVMPKPVPGEQFVSTNYFVTKARGKGLGQYELVELQSEMFTKPY